MSRESSNLPNVPHAGTDVANLDHLPKSRSQPQARFSDGLITEARELFEQRGGRPLTNEDARQILENLVGFFRTLNQWEHEQRARLPSPPE